MIYGWFKIIHKLTFRNDRKVSRSVSGIWIPWVAALFPSCQHSLSIALKTGDLDTRNNLWALTSSFWDPIWNNTSAYSWVSSNFKYTDWMESALCSLILNWWLLTQLLKWNISQIVKSILLKQNSFRTRQMIPTFPAFPQGFLCRAPVFLFKSESMSMSIHVVKNPLEFYRSLVSFQ